MPGCRYFGSVRPRRGLVSRLAPLGAVLFIDRGDLPSALEEEICL